MSLLNANEYKISDSRENAALSVLITPRNWVHPIFAATFVTRSRLLLAWWRYHRRGLAGILDVVDRSSRDLRQLLDKELCGGSELG